MGGLSEPSVSVEVGGTDGLTGISRETSADQQIFNLSGQRVSGSYKGIVISKGKKVVTK